MAYQTELGRVRGLGSARSGTHHWWRQRVVSLANLLLVTWFLVSLLRLPALDYITVVEWMRQPLVAVPLVLLATGIFYELRLGLQVVIEDYVHGHGARVASMLALNAYAVIGWLAAVFSILRIALTA